MPKYAVFVRGINVGGKAKVPMAELRTLLSKLGFADVRTLLQSGNVVLSTPGAAGTVARQIERGIKDTFQLEVSCLVWSRDQLRAVIDGNPLSDVATDGSKLMAFFLSDRPDPRRLAEHDPRLLAPDHIRVGDQVVYQWCPDGFLEAPAVGPFLEKRLGLRATARNWNTVTKLAAMFEG
jgi:uncharacterized protein (DUF1697 family)